MKKRIALSPWILIIACLVCVISLPQKALAETKGLEFPLVYIKGTKLLVVTHSIFGPDAGNLVGVNQHIEEFIESAVLEEFKSFPDYSVASFRKIPKEARAADDAVHLHFAISITPSHLLDKPKIASISVQLRKNILGQALIAIPNYNPSYAFILPSDPSDLNKEIKQGIHFLVGHLPGYFVCADMVDSGSPHNGCPPVKDAYSFSNFAESSSTVSNADQKQSRNTTNQSSLESENDSSLIDAESDRLYKICKKAQSESDKGSISRSECAYYFRSITEAFAAGVINSLYFVSDGKDKMAAYNKTAKAFCLKDKLIVQQINDYVDPPPINESIWRVNLGKYWTTFGRYINGKEAVYGGADYRVFASS